MTELFSAEHRTFFVLRPMPVASFHIFVCLIAHMYAGYHWSLGKIAKRMPIEPKLEFNYHIKLKLFVR